MRNALTIPLLAAVLLAAPALRAADEGVRIPRETVEQLQRIKPLTPEMIKVFLDSGRLSIDQANVVSKHVGADGVLALPEQYIGTPAPQPAPPAGSSEPVPEPYRGAAPADRSGRLDVLAFLRELDRQPLPALSEAERARLGEGVRNYRRLGLGERANLLRELKDAGPAANTLIAAYFTDPVDLDVKSDLWRAVANRANPRAAGYVAATHTLVMHKANPMLIPYDKDAGGIVFRREKGKEQPREKFYESRELREIALSLEKSISQASGVRAVSYLVDVYAARYEADEAPMRDKSRDRGRMVYACGGVKDDFEDDKPETWASMLGPLERAMIAERLVPHLRSDSGSQREIAMCGLLTVLGVKDKKLKDRLKDAHKRDEWPSFVRWWEKQRARLLSEAGK